MSLKRIFYYYWLQMRHHKMLLFLVLGLYGVAIILADIVAPLFYREIIDTVSGGAPRAEVAGEVMRLMGLLAGLIAFYMTVFRLADFSIVRFEAHVIRRLSNYSFAQLMRHSRSFFADNFSGSLVAKTRRFVASSERLFDSVVYNFWWASIKLPALIISLAFAAPMIAIILLVWTLVYIAVVVLMVRRGMCYDKEVAKIDSRVTGQVADTITNILNIKMFSSSSREQERFGEIIAEDYRRRMKSWNFEMWQYAIQGALLAILQIVGMYVVLKLWIAGSVSAGTVVLVQMYFVGIFSTVWNLSKGMKNFVRGLTDAQEMVDIFEEVPNVLDIDKPEKCHIKSGEIVFDKVGFAYGDDKQKVFHNLDLTIPAGQKIGIVGTSGAGKSTIVSLLLRFENIDSGKILIDGQNIAQIVQDDLRAQIAYVPQEPILFHRSVYENIAYARPDASRKDIVAAAKKARAHDFIIKLSEGYDTIVGERGIKLSGGQRQRIAIARAMVKNAPILILDEATSALDSESEAYIQEAFDELMKGKTVIVVAHRLSTLRTMDRIIVLDDGQLRESGTHRELTLRKNGIYANLWRHQSGGFVE